MRSVCLITAAVLLMGFGPLSAANKASIVGLPHSITNPDATPGTMSVGFLATGVLMTRTDPEGIVPCFNCVSGVDIETLLLGVPINAIQSGASVTIIVLGDDLFYGGNATFSYSIKPNPTAAPVSSGSVGGDVSPGSWFAQFPISAPAPGEYVLEGTISVGQTQGQSVSSTTKLIIGRATS